MLRKDAVPTIFLNNPKSLQVREQKKRRALKRAISLPVRASKRPKISDIEQIITDHSYCLTEERFSKQLHDSESKMTFFRKTLKAVRQKNSRLQKNVDSLKNILSSIKEKFNIEDHVVDILKQAGAEIPEALFNRLTRNLSTKSTTREEYPPALQSFALTLHFHSPKAYRQDFFCLKNNNLLNQDRDKRSKEHYISIFYSNERKVI